MESKLGAGAASFLSLWGGRSACPQSGGQVQEESGTRYSEEGQLSEQATLSDFTTIKNAKHTSFNLDPNYYGVLGVNDFPLLQHRGITTQLWGWSKGVFRDS